MNRFSIDQSMIEATISNEQAYERYIVAESDLDEGSRALAGMMYFSRSPMSWNGNRGVYIEDLYVKERFRRGHGVGTKLLGAACLQAVALAKGDTDRAFVRLDTAANNNDDTLRYYEGRGFNGYNTNLRLGGVALEEMIKLHT